MSNKVKILLVGVLVSFTLLVSGCASLSGAKKQAAAAAVKQERTVTIEMRFDASELIDKIAETDCVIENVKIEASKRKDEISINCRDPEASKRAPLITTITTP